MSIFQAVLNMIQIPLDVYTKKNTEEKSLQCFRVKAFNDLCHEPYVILPRTIIKYHNQNHRSNVFLYHVIA